MTSHKICPLMSVNDKPGYCVEDCQFFDGTCTDHTDRCLVARYLRRVTEQTKVIAKNIK